MNIAGHDVNQKVFIIAEIGNNHEGNFDLACEMIDRAAEVGADAVKFQTIIPELLVTRADIERISRLKKFQFSYSQFEQLKNEAQKKDILFFSTPFDITSAVFLDRIQPVFKIASGDNNFFPLIEKVASFGKPILISTGLSNISLLEKIHNLVTSEWQNKNQTPGLAFLHCVTSYPVPNNEANLGVIKKIQSTFQDVIVGYSDHTIGIKASVYAVAAGARIIEKHFTINKQFSDFRDHQLSADPQDMRQLINDIRELEVIMGSGVGNTYILDCEKDMHIAARRSIAARTDICAGTVLSQDHLTWVRPGTGMPPGSEHILLGRKARRDISTGEIFSESDVR
jgi:N,N'-diacetyllegionaminate synthase